MKSWRWHRSVLGLLLCLAASFRVSPVPAAELAPCPDFDADVRAFCGHVTVLEDRAHPDGRTIDLNVMVLRAEQPEDKAPVFLLAGGPGQGATDLAGVALVPYAEVRKTRDFVLVDQRGTGKSNRLDCINHSDTKPEAIFGQLFDPKQIAVCAKEASGHARLDLYGTLQVVADLDEVRAQLGYDKVVLWGGSGGTRTALVWMREHPEYIEAAVLDGVVPTDFRAPSGYARSSQDALDRVFADCEAQPDCQAAFPRLRQEFATLLERFDKGPIETTVRLESGEEVRVQMHRGDLGYALRGILYNSAQIPGLPAMLHAAATTGDLSPLAERHWLRDVALRPVVAMGVHFSVFGTEDVPYINPKDIPALTQGTFLGRYLIDQYVAACKAWGGRGVLPENFFAPVRSDIPVLLLSGWYDPSTPPRTAEAVAAHLPNSRHIVVRNEAHISGFGCARQLVVDFLIQGSLEGLGPVCEDAGPIRFETP